MIDLIYNRTADDVKNAIKIRDEKVKNFIDLTDEEREIMEKGMMTTTTLNRIETAQKEAKELINSIGYWNAKITEHDDWDTTMIFSADDFSRILGNIDILRNAFMVYASTPNTPTVSYNYNDINSIEKILYDISRMVDEIKNNYRECSENTECGG